MDMINEEHVGEEKSMSKEPSSRPAAAGERPKRDEWSEGAVDRLLDVYESKWVLRNRAKLKGQDWEEVARLVSSRGASSTKPTPKTSTQCKNKIESMKKRYRSESAVATTGNGSRWPLFSRLDGLVRCRMAQPATDDETKPKACDVPATATRMSTQSLGQSNGVAATAARRQETQEEDCVGGNTLMQPDEMEEAANHHQDATWKERRKKKKKKKKNDCRKETEPAGEGNNEVLAESIQWLAEVAVRMEQARAETMREVEKMWAEAEAKKGEMDLKRTEIIANTQLRIATILARSSVVELDHLPTADD